MKLYFFIGLFISVISISLSAQVALTLKSNESVLNVEGTSTLHDWEMNVEQMEGNILISSIDKIESIQQGEISFNVKSLVSEHSLMNKKAYSALKEDKYPIIKGRIIRVFSLAGVQKVELELSTAGVTKVITSNFKSSRLNNNQIKVNGYFDFKLTDFDIDPPVALMGTIKTGDAVKVKYSLVFKVE